MPVHLRGHHFLCMLTFRGLGYSAEFTANMAAKIMLIKTGAPVTLVNGPDDICAGMTKACINATGHDCQMADIIDMDKTARFAVEAVLNRNLEFGSPISSKDLKKLRVAFSQGSIRKACIGCSWIELCNQIAADNFSGTHLLGGTA
jgi:uncharacterized protein